MIKDYPSTILVYKWQVIKDSNYPSLAGVESESFSLALMTGTKLSFSKNIYANKVLCIDATPQKYAYIFELLTFLVVD